MFLADLLSRTGDLLTVRRAYGEPYERNGTTVLPVATVSGGGGGGGGGADGGAGDGEGGTGQGGGFGFNVKPAGVYVIDADGVRWRPAVDVNRLVGAVAIVTTIAMLTRTRRLRLRLRAERVT